jgi:CheY-like chemotaxis protein
METTSPLPRPVVLIVDDDNIVHSIVTRVLSGFSGTVLHATDGLSALKMARLLPPDLVITDALLPKLDGRELAKALKSEEDTKNCKVVVMTGLYKAPRYRFEALSNFLADEYLHKPVAPGKIKALAEEAAAAMRFPALELQGVPS